MNTVSVTVTGMTCGHCASSVRDEVGDIPGVTAVDVHLGTGKVTVRRDMVGFQHVHPTMDGAGTWSVPVDLSAGDYRVFADFIPVGGENLTLGADLHVAGRYDPQPLPARSTTATVDGFTVQLSGSP